jgi:predicted PurR-regulated permease PerM
MVERKHATGISLKAHGAESVRGVGFLRLLADLEMNQPVHTNVHAPPGRSSEGAPQIVLIRARTLWLAAAIGVGIFLAWLVVTSALNILFLLFTAIILAEGIRPIVAWLNAHKVPRWGGVLLVYLAIFLVFGSLMYLLVQPLVSEILRLIDHLPEYLDAIQNFIGQIQNMLNGRVQLTSITGQLGGITQDVVSVLVKTPITLAQWAFGAIVVLLLAFFWLTGIDALKPFVVGLLPLESQPVAASALSEMGLRVGGYLRGVVVNMFVIGILSGVAVWLLGVPFPIALGVLAGLTEAIPLLGPFIGGGVAVIVALASGSLLQGAEVAAAYIVIQQFEGNILVPVVQERAVQLEPLSVVLALLVGGALFGVIGALLAVPAAAALKVLLVQVLAPAARRASGLPSEGEHTSA